MQQFQPMRFDSWLLKLLGTLYLIILEQFHYQTQESYIKRVNWLIIIKLFGVIQMSIMVAFLYTQQIP